jgi:hypothetical protein
MTSLEKIFGKTPKNKDDTTKHADERTAKLSTFDNLAKLAVRPSPLQLQNLS